MKDVGLEELHHGEGLEAELGGNRYLMEMQNKSQEKSDVQSGGVDQSCGQRFAMIDKKPGTIDLSA